MRFGQNRASSARQLVAPLAGASADGVIERPRRDAGAVAAAPYVGIWTRTTGFRRGSLERLLRRSTIVRATAMRQTLHLVTPRDYALISGGDERDELPLGDGAGEAARAVGARARGGPTRDVDGSDRPTRERVRLRRRRCAPRLADGACRRADRPPPRDRRSGSRATTAGSSRSPSRSRTSPSRRRAEIFRRYLAAFGPRRAATSGPGAGCALRRSTRAGAARAAAPLPRRAGPRAPRRPGAQPCQTPTLPARQLPAEEGQRAACAGPIARACSRRPTGRR